MNEIMNKIITILTLFLSAVALSKALNYHIVGIPSIGTSHGLVYVKIGRELTQRGYKYTLVVPTWQENDLKESLAGLEVKSYDTPVTDEDLEKVILKEAEGKLNITERNDF